MKGARAKAELHILVLAAAAAACLASPLQAEFRLAPYVQNPTATGATLVWFSEAQQAGELTVTDEHGAILQTLTSQPLVAAALDYHPSEPLSYRTAVPFVHEVRLAGLEPGRYFRYRVEQGDTQADGAFQTLPRSSRPLRFIVFGDSETEPESIGKHAHWPDPGTPGSDRVYPVDQERAYRENLAVIRGRDPDFVAIAGDLVESGGEQRDWDEFWRLTGPLAADTPLFPALGNHEYYAGPGEKGSYTEFATERAVAKYRTYFDLPANGVGPHHERYYRVDWGPVTLVSLDLGNGLPHRTETDGNWYLRGAGEGGFAPDWQKGSAQYRWLEATLREAQRTSVFTFVLFHYCPYSSGPHGRPPGDGNGQDRLSGVPLRALTPLFQQYGVDALLTGHDEMYEHSVVPGTEIRPNGRHVPHALHVLDVGLGGDGLRGPFPGVVNPYRVFLAHEDAPEVHDPHGRLVGGGKHYGHLEVNVTPLDDGRWQAQLDMVYLFPLTAENGGVEGFERRLYDDTTILVSGPGHEEQDSGN